MIKPAALRAAITTMLPDLGRDPQRLQMWADKGRIRATLSDNRGFAWEYTLNIVVTDYTGHPSLVFLAINDWLRVNQPDLLGAGQPGYPFEADIIDDGTVDLHAELALTEQVSLRSRGDGEFDLEHLAEPLVLDDDMALANPPALLKRIYWRNELLLPEGE